MGVSTNGTCILIAYDLLVSKVMALTEDEVLGFVRNLTGLWLQHRSLCHWS